MIFQFNRSVMPQLPFALIVVCMLLVSTGTFAETIEEDVFDNAIGGMTLGAPDGSKQPVTLTGTAIVRVFFPGTGEGSAVDSDGDGLEQVQTQLMSLAMAGPSLFGAIGVGLSSRPSSLGEIEEEANNTVQVLDLPPFARTGAASSGFEVYFEVEMGGSILRATKSLWLATTLHAKPPAHGDIYTSISETPLETQQGEPTGYSLIAPWLHLNPAVEIDNFENTHAQVNLAFPDGSNELITLNGPTSMNVYFEGSTEGSAIDDDGDGLDDVLTEITQMNLSGVCFLGPISIRLNSKQVSVGYIEEIANNTAEVLDLPPFAATGTANSFFDIFVEVEIGGQVLHTKIPKRMAGTISHKPPAPGDLYANCERVELFTEGDTSTGYYLDCIDHELNPPATETDVFEHTIGSMDIKFPDGSIETVFVCGPTIVEVFFEGLAEGTAYDDDGDGLDDVLTRMTQLELTGNSSIFGPIVAHLNPALPSMGGIEETANNTAGILDLPPFTPAGTANSFFDIFLEVEVMGIVLHNETAKHMSTLITHKPPDSANLYMGPAFVDLLNSSGHPTGFQIGQASHRPNPPLEEDTFVNMQGTIKLIMPDASVMTVEVAGSMKQHVYFEGAAEGQATDDNGNGREEVLSEIVEMSLSGNCILGTVQVHVSLLRRSLGLIEETANITPGLLDLPPFTATGTADSFFDIFFEIEAGGIVLHNETAQRIAGVIHHKPQAPGDSYESTEIVPLFEPTGQETEISLGSVFFTPNPDEGEGEMDNFHPADINKDWRIIMSEAIAYLAGWQQGGNPMAYAIRAAYIWQKGEQYLYDGSAVPPMCWILAP